MKAALSKYCYLILVVFMALGIGSASAQAGEPRGPKIKGLFAFGDSLTDTTNLDSITSGLLPATSPPYFDGRFSNGPLWVETLATLLGIDVDLQTSVTEDPLASMQAVGGAFTDTRNANALIDPQVAGTGILGQIGSFEDARGKIKRHDLVIVWGGANDYFGGSDPDPTIIVEDLDPVMVVNNLKRAVEDLETLGGYFFVVPNLPNLGDTPLALDLGLQDPLNALTAAHNAILAQVMAELEQELQVKILVLDVNAAFTQFENLFANQTIPCVIQNPPFPPIPTGICPAKPDGVPDSTANGGTLYMDVIHPTTEPHELLGAFAAGAITEAFRKRGRRR